MNGSFGNNVGVEAITEIDGIDVITVRNHLVSSLRIGGNKHLLDNIALTAATVQIARLSKSQKRYVLTILNRCT
jgi:hypothetical protein